MSTELLEQLQIYGEDFDAGLTAVTLDDLENVLLKPVGTGAVRPLQHRQSQTGPLRGWAYALATAAAVLVLVGGVALLLQVTGAETPVADTVVPTTLTDSTPTTVAEQELTNLPGSCDAASTWSRVCDEAAGFDRAVMWSVTAGGPGLVAVGVGGSNAAVWTSVDGVTWSRVPHDETLFGRGGVQAMQGVTSGGPGLVAVGRDGPVGSLDAAVWTSPDGITWSRVPHDETVFRGAGITSVTKGGPGFIAVGWAGLDAAAWTSPDGITWSRVPHDETIFGGQRENEISSVVAFGSKIVAVGDSGGDGDRDAAVWIATVEAP